jgi:hypothetical protein
MIESMLYEYSSYYQELVCRVGVAEVLVNYTVLGIASGDSS